MKIKNESEAKQVWERIEQKYAHIIPELPAEQRARYQKKITPDDFKRALSNQDLERIRTVQRYWNKRRDRDTLISVNSEGNHASDMRHFINQQKIKRSLNRKKLHSLAKAMHSGDWDDSIFQDETLPQLAMSLYASNKISQQQMYSILERHQIKKDLTIRKTYQILDANNQFTPEATLYLPKLFENRQYLKKLSVDQIEAFRLLIATLPLSERVFYITDLGSVDRYSLGNTLVTLDSIYKDFDELIHLTSGARDALGIARFGEGEYVRPMLRLGEQKISDIEYGVRKQARYTAIHYPGTKAYSDELHGWDNITALEATSHDFYHGHVMSTIPKNLVNGLWRLVDLIREKTGFEWSKEIWDWIDANYTFTFHYHQTINTHNLDNEQTTALFCNMLCYATAGKVGRGGALIQHQNSFFSRNKWSPTALGLIVYLDMLKHPDEWLKMGIDPNHLISPFKQHLAALRDIYPTIENNDFKVQMVKCFMRLTMGNKVKHDILELVDEFATEIEQKISIKKIKKTEETFKNPANTIQFTYDGAEMSSAKIYNDLKKLKYHARSSKFERAPSFVNWTKANPVTAGFMLIPALTIPIFIYACIQVRSQMNKNKQSENAKTNYDQHGIFSSSAAHESDINAHDTAHTRSRAGSAST